jgi:hypothetical protein
MNHVYVHFSFAPFQKQHSVLLLLLLLLHVRMAQLVYIDTSAGWGVKPLDPLCSSSFLLRHSKMVCVFTHLRWWWWCRTVHYWVCGTCRAQWTILSRLFAFCGLKGERRKEEGKGFLLCVCCKRRFVIERERPFFKYSSVFLVVIE